MIKWLLLTLLVLGTGYLVLPKSASAYQYGYHRGITVDGISCNKVTVQAWNSADSAMINFSSINLLVQGSNDGNSWTTLGTYTPTNASSYVTPCLSNSYAYFNLQLTMTIASTGHVIQEGIFWELGTTPQYDNIHFHILDTATPTNYGTYPADDEVIGVKNFSRRVYAVPRNVATNDIDYLYDYGFQYWNGSSWVQTNVPEGEYGPYGDHGVSANLVPNASGEITAAARAITSPATIMAGTRFRWFLESLDQETPNIDSVFGTNESKWWLSYPGWSYFYMGANMLTENAVQVGTLTVGSPIHYNGRSRNASANIVAQASNSRLQILRESDDSVMFTSNRAISQLSPGLYEDDVFSDWTAQAGRYYAMMCADSNDDVMETSEVNCQTLPTFDIPPATPAPTSSGISCSGATISWPAVAGAASYRIVRTPTTGSPATPTITANTSQAFTGLSASTAYSFTVQAFVGAGATGASGPISSAVVATTTTCTPPAQPVVTQGSPSCSGISFSWPAVSGAASYQITRTPTSGSPASPITQSGVSVNFTGLSPNTAYTYTVRAYSGAGATGLSSTPYNGSFTTLVCKTLTLNPIGPVTVVPGSGNNNQTNILAYAGPWVGTDASTLYVTSIASGTIDCSAIYPGNNTAVGGLSAGIGATTQANQAYTYSNTGVLVINAATGTTNGAYTICLAARGPAGVTDPANVAVTINVRNSAWIQVGVAGGGLFSGEVHSNAGINGIALPNLTTYFFTTGVAGVVTANGSMSMASTQIAGSPQPDWLQANYGLIKTSAYTTLVSKAKANTGQTSLPTESIDPTSILSHCSGSSGVYQSAAGSVTISAPVAFSSSCNGKNVIYFINGDLTVNSNITDSSTTGTLTFVVSGNVIVAGSVTRLDGVYMFGGNFSDGNTDMQLTVNGALLGLTGDTPTVSTGSFTSSGVPGLDRDLGTGSAGNGNLKNESSPAELIIYQPKYIIGASQYLGSSTFVWEE